MRTVTRQGTENILERYAYLLTLIITDLKLLITNEKTMRCLNIKT